MAEARTKGPDEKYCSSCGQIVKMLAEICPLCGVRQMPVPFDGYGGRLPSGYGATSDAVVPMLFNGFLGFVGFMGIGHMVAGSAGRGTGLLLLGWVITVFGLASAFAAFVVGVVFLVIAYIVIWVWSIVDVRSVVEMNSLGSRR